MPGRRARRVMAAPRVLTKCLAAKQQRNAVDASHGTVRHIRGSARTEADHDGQEGRQGAGGTPRLPGRPAWREPGRGATCRAGRGAVPVVSGETDSARRGGCRMAGGPDVERHAAAAACDGKGIRVNRAIPHYGAGSGYPGGYPGRPAKLNTTAPGRSRGRGARLLPPEANRAESTAAHVRHGSIWRIANNVRVDPRGRRPWRRNPNSRAPSGEDDAPTALRPAPAPEAGRRRLARHAPGLPHQSARPCVRPRRGPRAGRRSRDTRFRRDRSRSRNRRRTPRATD